MFSEVSWTLGAAIFAVTGATAAAILLWFLLRQQKKRSLLPILQVLELQLKVVPKLRWTKPPLWPFVCFIIAAAALTAYTLEPSESLVKRENLDLRYTHVVFDLSPSVASYITPADYAHLADDVLNRLDHKAKLSFSVSSSPEIFAIGQRDELTKLIAQEGFHRAGFKVGAAVEQLLNLAPDIEHLVIVSDNDRASWEDFNWAYLEKKVQVSWFPLQKEIIRSNNVFIDDVKAPTASSLTQNWTVTIRRSSQGEAIKGTLSVDKGGKTYGETPWSFDGTTSSIEMEVKLPKEALAGQTNVLWVLKTDAKDDLIADNTFRAWINSHDRKAILVSQPRGEMFLEDAFFHLKTSLDVLGFKTQRLDKIVPHNELNGQLIVAEAKPTQPRSFFCPAIKKANEFNRQIWLVPSEGMRDYGELCACAASFIQAPKDIEGIPQYCENLETRDQYVSVLLSLGALQLGGDVNSPLGALAMQYLNKSSGIRLLAFSVPLTPSATTGISFGRMPLLLNSLFQVAPLEGGKFNFGKWPRIDNISGVPNIENLALSNVPFLESSFQTLPETRMPPKLSFGEQGMIRQNVAANREKDARPWIITFLWILAAAIWMEVMGNVIARIFRGQKWVQRWFVGLLIAGAAFGGKPAEAQVKLNMVGYAKTPVLNTVRRDVAGRTSIELLDLPKQNTQINADALSEPWLWVAQPSLIEGLSRTDRAELIAWLQRGGFLIVENYKGAGDFRSKIFEAIPQGQWKLIPPDHELMRSFHLLASLPQCGDVGWEGFQFDQRLAILLIPGDFLESVTGQKGAASCFANLTQEGATKIFINLMMVVLTTDYKKDQVHLPEILKRLR
ncbi:MAG: DUF4159 domain-containing protein [Chitinophagaceae bacterium]|nr:DUF4159 domain-containing protein [Oligoflexus sp.]